MNIEEIKAREQAATKGPWINDARIGCVAVYCGKEANCIEETIDRRLFYADGKEVLNANGEFDHWETKSQDVKNAAFIAHARTDIPELIAEVERLTAENTALQNANEKLATQSRRIINREMGRDQQIATLKKALLESIKCFNCSTCSYGRGKDCGQRPHENCTDVFIRKVQEAHEMQEVEK